MDRGGGIAEGIPRMHLPVAVDLDRNAGDFLLSMVSVVNPQRLSVKYFSMAPVSGAFPSSSTWIL